MMAESERRLDAMVAVIIFGIIPTFTNLLTTDLRMTVKNKIQVD